MIRCPQCNRSSTVYFINGQPKCGACNMEFGRGDFILPVGRADATVVHVDAHGNYRFPGHADAPVPPGFERRELHGRDIDRMERTVNSQQRRDREMREELRAQSEEPRRSASRSDLMHAMRSMTPAGRDFAQYAIDRANNRVRGRYDPGFHVESRHYDASNRDAHRDGSGGRGRK